MTVKELKEKLNEFDDDLEISVSDQCGGGYDPKYIELLEWTDKDGKKFKMLDIS